MSIPTPALREFVNGLGFGEAPRWHDGALWVSDILTREVLRIDTTGSRQTVLTTPGDPSGLGWLPDGSLLVVQMQEHEVWRWHENTFKRFSITGHISRCKLNDMVIDRDGNAWVSNLGFDYETDLPCTTSLVHINSKGHASVAARDLWCPNGMAINPRGNRLIVGQSASQEVLEFTIGEDGKLYDRRTFGTLAGKSVCDGICMDAEEALWIASPSTREFVRMQRGGTITHRINTGNRCAIACVLGGPGRNTLYAVTAATLSLRDAHGTRTGRIEIADAPVPGAGVP